MDITEVKAITGKLIWEKGNKIYEKNNNFFHIKEIDNDFLSKVFTVLIKDFKENSVKVKLKLGQDDKLIDFHCECERYMVNKKKKPCEHIIAAILYYAYKDNLLCSNKGCGEDTNLKYKEHTCIDEIKNTESCKCEILENKEGDEKEEFEINLLKQKLEVLIEIKEIEKEGSHIFGVALWIGEKKFLKISNINNFLYTFNSSNNTMKVNSKFVYDPRVHTFSNSAKKIIEIFMQNKDSDYNKKNIEYLENESMVFLRDRDFQEVLRLWDKKIILFNDGNARSKLPVVRKDMPLVFKISRAKSFIKMRHGSEIPKRIIENGSAYIFKEAMYIPSKRQIDGYTPIYNAFKEEGDTLVIYKELNELAFENFFTNVEGFGGKIITENEEVYKDKVDSLKVDFYLDFKFEKISLKVIFKYPDGEIDPFSPNKYDESKKVKKRELGKEGYILNIIKELGFDMYSKEFSLEEEKLMISFLEKGMLQLEEFGEIYKTQEFDELKVIKPKDFSTNLSLSRNNLLEFTFNIDGISAYDVKGIVKAINEGKDNYFLGTGKYVDLSEKTLKNISNLISYIDVKDVVNNTNTIITSKYSALYIDKVLKSNNIRVNCNKEYIDLINEFKPSEEGEIAVSKELNDILRSYQREGFIWLKSLYNYGFGGILADEMGLGKTIQSIALIDAYVRQNRLEKEEKKPVLVICPAALIYNWVQEIEKFASYLDVAVAYGNEEDRLRSLQEFKKSDVIITSYTTLNKDMGFYLDKGFSICIIDEAQNIKNPRSAISRAVKNIQADCRIALTGTPIENRLEEIWSIFDFIMPGYLLSNKEFNNRYIVPIEQNNNNALEALNRQIQPFILRRYKKDVVKELPDKIEKVISIELSKEEKEIYMAYNSILRNEIIGRISVDGFNKSKIHLLAGLTKLKQLCCNPSIIMDNYDGPKSKLESLYEIIEESLLGGNRVIVFSQYVRVLRSIALGLRNKNIEYFYLDGQIPGKERVELAKRFNHGEREVFLASLKAGGTGLNLTGANVVVHFDLWWNPAVEAQATDRAHRIGQNKTVEVIKLVANGTIEEKIMKIQEKKKNLIENLIDIDDMEKSLIAEMTIEEVKELFQ